MLYQKRKIYGHSLFFFVQLLSASKCI